MSGEYLNKEIKWFDANRKELLEKYKGKWAVVYHRSLVGAYDSFSEAYDAGIEKTKSEEILIKRITKKDDPFDPSINITLDLLGVPTNL